MQVSRHINLSFDLNLHDTCLNPAAAAQSLCMLGKVQEANVSVAVIVR